MSDHDVLARKGCIGECGGGTRTLAAWAEGRRRACEVWAEDIAFRALIGRVEEPEALVGLQRQYRTLRRFQTVRRQKRYSKLQTIHCDTIGYMALSYTRRQTMIISAHHADFHESGDVSRHSGVLEHDISWQDCVIKLARLATPRSNGGWTAACTPRGSEHNKWNRLGHIASFLAFALHEKATYV